MTSSVTTAAKKTRAESIREAAERIYDPGTIEAKLAGLPNDQADGLLKIYKAGRRVATAGEIAQRRELVRLFRQATQDIEADIYSVFRSLGSEKWDLASVRRVGRDKVLLDQINNRLRALGAEVTGTLEDGLLDQFKKSYVHAAYQLDTLTPPSTSIRFGLMPDQEILAILNQPFDGARFSDRLGLITDDMAHKIQQQLAYSMIAEESWQDAARRIRDEMGTKGQRSVWRAEMIARTELARASELASQELFEQNDDVIEKVVWVAHPTACDECKDKHGEEIEDTEDYPPLHPNCVCAALAVPKGWGDLAETEDGDFSIRKSKKAWARDNNLADVTEG